jgi:hypothetical protein
MMNDRKQGRRTDTHRAVAAIFVVNDAGDITQKYRVDDAGHLVPPMANGMSFGSPTLARARQHPELHPPPVPMIPRVFAPIRTLQTPEEGDPFYAPRFFSRTIYDSRAGIESDFEIWEPPH